MRCTWPNSCTAHWKCEIVWPSSIANSTCLFTAKVSQQSSWSSRTQGRPSPKPMMYYTPSHFRPRFRVYENFSQWPFIKYILVIYSKFVCNFTFPYFRKISFPIILCSYNLRFWLRLRFFLPPILTMMHLCIMLYTCWTPLLTPTHVRKNRKQMTLSLLNSYVASAINLQKRIVHCSSTT